jgi:hypothetical protein
MTKEGKERSPEYNSRALADGRRTNVTTCRFAVMTAPERPHARS